jgi:hypothetical protein
MHQIVCLVFDALAQSGMDCVEVEVLGRSELVPGCEGGAGAALQTCGPGMVSVCFCCCVLSRNACEMRQAPVCAYLAHGMDLLVLLVAKELR